MNVNRRHFIAGSMVALTPSVLRPFAERDSSFNLSSSLNTQNRPPIVIYDMTDERSKQFA